jgi:hypothetical protein
VGVCGVPDFLSVLDRLMPEVRRAGRAEVDRPADEAEPERPRPRRCWLGAVVVLVATLGRRGRARDAARPPK